MFSGNLSKGRLRPFTIGVVLLAALAGQAFGDVFYTYTGYDYTEFAGFGGPFTSLDNLTLSFEVPSALAPSAEYFFTQPGNIVENPSLVGWQSFDGVYSTSSSDLQENPFLYGEVSTNASGNISSWAFTVGIAQTPADGETALSESSCNLVEPCSNIFGGAPFDYVQANIGNLPYVAAGSETAGTWTSTASTPEPNFFWLLALGMGLLVMVRLFGRRTLNAHSDRH